MYKNCKCKKKKPLMRLFFLVELRGFEPLISTLPV